MPPIPIAEDVLFEIFGFLTQFCYIFGNVRLVNRRWARIGLPLLPPEVEHFVDELLFTRDEASGREMVKKKKPIRRYVEVPPPFGQQPPFILGYKRLRIAKSIGPQLMDFIQSAISTYTLSFTRPRLFPANSNTTEYFRIFDRPLIIDFYGYGSMAARGRTDLPIPSSVFQIPEVLQHNRISLSCSVMSIGFSPKAAADWLCHLNGNHLRRLHFLGVMIDALVSELARKFDEESSLSPYCIDIYRGDYVIGKVRRGGQHQFYLDDHNYSCHSSVYYELRRNLIEDSAEIYSEKQAEPPPTTKILIGELI